MNKKLMIGTLVALLLLLTMVTPVLADGAFFSPEFFDLWESAQRAVILYGNSTGNCTENCTVNGTEHLILSVSFEGNAEDFAWVIPVPNMPEISVTDADLFWELSDLTTKDIPTKPEYGFGCAASPPSEGGVDVIEQKVVGPYATAVLSATNATALVDWLNTNGYIFPEEGEEIISAYIEKEWYFVATRINAVDKDTGRALAEGDIEPIVLSFASDRIVYPLRISSLSATSYPPQILLYVLTDHLVVPERYPLYIGYRNWVDNAFTLEFGSNVSVVEDLSEYEILPEIVSNYLPGDTFYLTKLRGWIHAERMVDIELVRYLEADSLDPLAETHTKGDDIVVVTIIIGPVFGLYLWRRRRSTIISRVSG